MVGRFEPTAILQLLQPLDERKASHLWRCQGCDRATVVGDGPLPAALDVSENFAETGFGVTDAYDSIHNCDPPKCSQCSSKLLGCHGPKAAREPSRAP